MANVFQRLWFYVKWVYIIWATILLFAAIQTIVTFFRGGEVNLSGWDIMVIGGLKYNWILGVFAFSFELFLEISTGRLFRWAADQEPEPSNKRIPEPQIVYGEVIEATQTIAAHSYNRNQLGSGARKWVSDNLDDLENGGLWTPKWIDRIMCPTCGNAQWASLLVDEHDNWIHKYRCKTCNTVFDS